MSGGKHSRRRERAVVFAAGLVIGLLAIPLWHALPSDYWRNPGWFQSEIPRLHAWGLRLMANGGPGRNGIQKNHLPGEGREVPRSEQEACWQDGKLFTIRYRADDDTLTAIYRCELNGLGGQLNASFYGPGTARNNESSYVFSVFDPTQDPGIDHLDNIPVF